MPGHDRACALLAGDEAKELVAHAAGGFFDAHATAGGGLAHVALAGEAFNVQPGAEVADEIEVLFRRVAEAVVEMGGEEVEAEALAQAQEEEEAGYRVGATGDGGEDAAGPAEQPFGAGKPLDGANGAISRAANGGRGAPTIRRGAALRPGGGG